MCMCATCISITFIWKINDGKIIFKVALRIEYLSRIFLWTTQIQQFKSSILLLFLKGTRYPFAFVK